MQTHEAFTCLTLSPLGLPPRIAIASVRAGAVALLDAEYCDDPQVALSTLTELLRATRPEHRLGLRLTQQQLTGGDYDALLEALSERAHWLVLSQWQTDDAEEGFASLTPNPQRTVLAEITASSQLAALPGLGLPVDGLLAKGHESGGWVGEESAFILAQRLLAKADLPVYVQGALGLHTAAACRAAGAAGVVIDDALLLMPESPLPEPWRERLRGVVGQDSVPLGPSGHYLRVLIRPGLEVASQLREAADQCRTLDDWYQNAAGRIGWDSPEVRAWPVGQGIGLAARMRERHKTTGRFLQALQTQSQAAVTAARRLRVLQPGAALAVSHGTEFPIVQGPMTRVSDTAAFAAAVAAAGGLPMIALALMQPAAVEKVLSETRDRLGERPWGIGILGFVPQEIREAQLEVVLRIKPQFALIAGGRPDQAARLEREGIASYLHVPTPNLARIFIEQGARRLVFEGRECGGHVGPLSSFALWETVVDSLLTSVPESAFPDLHLLFAGGIHDGGSAVMIEALTAPLAERGAKIGVLMGTAYLFTEEAVATGAITDGFQQQALACTDTVTLETGPGHASRCAITPFADEFFDTGRRLRAEGRSATDVSQALEALSLGRLRIAAKGITRQGSELLEVEPKTQLRDGMYMIGQAAALRDQVVSLRALHESVCRPARDSAAQDAVALESAQPAAVPSDIAIVGIGTILPKADSPQAFWDNIIAQVDAISEIPPTRWDWRLYYDADPKARDKVYSKWGCVLQDVPFDPGRFGIPPRSLSSIDPIQLLALEAVRRALDDASYLEGDFDREQTGVVFGYSGGLGELGEHYVARTELSGRVDDPTGGSLDGLPEWTEDSFPGLLPNVAAGRVANRFDLGGANFTVDAACASSLTAIDVAVAQLESGRSNLMIAGGVDTKLSAFAYLCFSKTPALTPQDRSHPLDAAADGILLGEGAAAVILKRLADAERDGDRIYAVIKGSASSSDGKAMGMTAPNSKGQLKAFTRAYAKAGISAASIGFYEAHGTGTRVGDETEVRSLTSLLSAEGAAAKTCAVGSVKALIGHTKSTAGVAALVKTALALHYRTLPPQPGVTTPLPALADPDSPVYLLRQAQPWLTLPEHRRRAGASAFGFGGTNCHCVLEEYSGNLRPVAVGGEHWPQELVLLSAAGREALLALVTRLHERLAACDPLPPLHEIAYSCALRGMESGARLALVVASTEVLIEALRLSAEHLRQDQPGRLPPHILVGDGVRQEPGKLAFLFPGQGAQSLDMAREVALYCEPMRRSLTAADAQFAELLPQPLSRYLFPPGLFSEEAIKAAEQRLTETAIAQPAIGAVELGYLALVRELGLSPDMVAGHSFGEYTALHAAAVLTQTDFLRLARVRGESMSQAGQTVGGGMAAVNADREQVQASLEGTEVVIANHNTPQQTVISGPDKALEAVVEGLEQRGIRVRRLAVSGAFHSPLMRDSQGRLDQEIRAVAMAAPTLPVYSNIDAQPYAGDVEAVRHQLSHHLLSPVEFVAQVEAMYAAGARRFVEVGPKSILTGLVGQILGDRPHRAVALDGNGGGLRGLLIALGALFVDGEALDLLSLFAARASRRLTLPDLPELKAEAGAAAPGWLVSGGGIRQRGATLPLHIPQRIRPADSVADAVSPMVTQALSSVPQEQIHMADVSSPEPRSARQAASTGDSSTDPSAAQALPTTTAALAAYEAYQQTMHQFLLLQEQTMAAFLTGAPVTERPHRVRSTSVPSQRSDSVAIAAPAAAAASASALPVSAGLAVAANPATSPAGSTSQDRVAAVAAAAVTGQAASASVLDREALTTLLVEVVSDSTGYPPEMLGLEQDLEADLGIDSIKRVEILASLEGRLPAELSQGMAARMEDFTRVKSLAALVDQLLASSAQAGTSAAVATLVVAPGTAPSAQPQVLVAAAGVVAADAAAAPGSSALAMASVPMLGREALIALLVEVVSDSTGYPPEMLGLEQDLEADLGIDSIKRVEILASLEGRLPAELSQGMAARMEDFTRVKSLAALVEQLLASSRDNAPAPAPAPASAPAATTVAAAAPESKDATPAAEVQLEDRVQRFIMRARPAPLPPHAASPELRGLVLISPDPHGAADALARRLEQAGITAAVLPSAALDDRQRLEREIAALREASGPVAALVHLPGLDSRPLPDSLEDWRYCGRLQAKSLFHLLQICAADLRETSGRILSASMLGGSYGRQGQCGPGLPLGAGAAGLLKTIAIEWPEVMIRTIDFDESPAEALARQLFDELLSADTEPEVGYIGDTRQAFYASNEPLDSSIVSPVEVSSDWVLLALGGARGITAEAVRELAVPGMTLVLIGRSDMNEDEPECTHGVEDVGELRKRLITEAKKQGQMPTPAEIDRGIRKLRRAREIRSNIQEFKALGAAVEYHALDVNDTDDFVRLLDDVYLRFGRIDAVVQGVGVIEDKLLVDKEPASFERVLDTKVDATYLLCRHLRPESLKLVILFASVAGRTGNRGQCDYATANEVLNRCAWWMHANWPRTRVLSLNWGPWAVTGMATEEVNRQFRERGVIPIPPAAGRRFMREEIRHGEAGSVELVAGIFDTSGQAGATPVEEQDLGNRLPMLTEMPRARADGSLGLSYTFSLSRDRYLNDHRLSGTAVVPAAVATELMAEVVQAGWSDWVVCEAQDVRVLRGIQLKDDADVCVTVRARAAAHTDGDEIRVDAEIAAADESYLHYRVAFVLRATFSLCVNEDGFDRASFDQRIGRPISVAEVYDNYCFHGPSFQLLESLEQVGDQGLAGYLRPSDPTHWIAGASASSRWIFDPGIVDTLLQMMIIWTKITLDSYPLPSRFGLILKGLPASGGGRMWFMARGLAAGHSTILGDFAVLNEDDSPFLLMRDVQGTHTKSLNRLSPAAAKLESESS